MREGLLARRARARGSVAYLAWFGASHRVAREYERESRAGDSRNATVARAFGRDARVGDSYK